MWYIYLLFILVFLAITYYFLFKRDVLSVSFISCVIYAISTLAAFIAYKVEGMWNYVELHSRTAMYIILAMICVGIGEYIVRVITNKKNEKKEELKPIIVTNLKILICVLFLLVTFLFIYVDMCKITNAHGISKVISIYKQNSALYNNEDVQQISFIYTQMYRVAIAMGIVFLYIYINNMCFNYRLKYNFKLLIPIFISMFLSILIGGRSAIMRFIVAAFIFFILIYNSKKKKIRLLKFIRIGALILVIVLPLFYMLLGVIGQTTQNSFANYITFYLGSPIPCFDEYLENSYNNDNKEIEHFGEHTFVGVQQILYKVHLIDYYNIYQSEWINFGNGLNSNVFTGIKTYLQDFGVSGIIVFQILFGMAYSYLYYKAQKSNYKYLIFYGLIGITLIDQFRSEKIFSTLTRIDTLVYVISIIIITWFLFNLKLERNCNNNERRR